MEGRIAGSQIDQGTCLFYTQGAKELSSGGDFWVGLQGVAQWKGGPCLQVQVPSELAEKEHQD